MNFAFRALARTLSLNVVLLLGFAAVANAAPTEPERPPRRIAVVRAEPSRIAGPLEAKVRQTVGEMTAARGDWQLVDAAVVASANDDDTIRRRLETALADPAIDYVLVLDTRTARLAAAAGVDLPKPVIGAVCADPDLVPLPIDSAGRSTKPNFAVVVCRAKSGELLARLSELVPFSALSVFVDPGWAGSAETLGRWQNQLENTLGCEVSVSGLEPSAAATLAVGLATAPTVFLLPAERMSEREHAALLAGFAARGARVLSYAGQPEVEAGALAGVLPEMRSQLARRVALVLDQLDGGTAVSSLDLDAPVEPGLFFNETIAAAVGFSPKFGALHAATLTGSYRAEEGEPLDFAEALATALDNNFDLRARKAGTEMSRQDARAAGGALLPQVAAVSTYQRIDLDRAQASGGIHQEKTWFAGFGLSQSLLDDEAIARMRAARAALKAADAVERVQCLNTAAAAAEAYLQCLAARAALRVAENNATATAKHLELARIRQRTGTSGPEDIYRFESLSAQQRSEINSARAQLQRARTNLNRVLGLPAERRWVLADVGLADPAFAGVTAPLSRFVDDRGRFERLREYLCAFAAGRSPDVEAAERGVDAQRLLTAQKVRRGVVPKVVATANFGRLVELDYGGPTLTEQLMHAGLPVSPVDLNRTVWTVGLEARLPLFTGGSLGADNRKARAQLRQMELTRDGARAAVVAYAQAGLYAIESSYANIALSRTAAELAEENLAVVREKYERGSLPIVSLLEAQNAAFARRQAAEVAVYRFLEDTVRLQRVCGRIEALATPEENAAWLAEIEAAVSR